MEQLNLASHMDARNRILLCADTEMKTLFLESLWLLDHEPDICKRIEADIDLAAKEEKKARMADVAWFDELTPSLPGLATRTVADVQQLNAASLPLGVGCPRLLDGEAVFLFMMCRAHLDSVTSRTAIDRLRDSLLVQEYLAGRGMRMPSRSGIHTYLNLISEQTREFVFNAQLRMIMSEGLETGRLLAIDSFSVGGCTSWPTDSRLLHQLLERAHRLGQKLDRFGVDAFSEAYLPAWLKELHSLDFTIACTAGKPKSGRQIKRLYRKFLVRAARTVDRLVKQCNQHRSSWKAVALPPSRRLQLDGVTELLEESLHAALRIICYAEARVFEGIVLPSAEKILSISDDCVAYIQKGGRNPVIGYKPQIARSGNGFVTAFELMMGNPSDANRLVPVAEQHVQRTGRVPDGITIDDGYSSRAGVARLKKNGTTVVSVSGSKGKHITSEADWESPEYVQARADRSAVESIIFTLRYNFNLYRFKRRGLEAVKAELTEKIIAYNFLRMAVIRERQREEQEKAVA